MTDVTMKNLFRMHILPNRIGAIWDTKVKQFFLNAKPQRLNFGGSERPFFFNLDLIYLIYCTGLL